MCLSSIKIQYIGGAIQKLSIYQPEGKLPAVLMWQITILILFLTFEVHVTEASCDETQMTFSQNHDKGNSPSNGKIFLIPYTMYIFFVFKALYYFSSYNGGCGYHDISN